MDLDSTIEYYGGNYSNYYKITTDNYIIFITLKNNTTFCWELLGLFKHNTIIFTHSYDDFKIKQNAKKIKLIKHHYKFYESDYTIPSELQWLDNILINNGFSLALNTEIYKMIVEDE